MAIAGCILPAWKKLSFAIASSERHIPRALPVWRQCSKKNLAWKLKQLAEVMANSRCGLETGSWRVRV